MSKLYRIREVSDLFVDACVRHPTSGELLFLSVFGRDGTMLEFFASFALPREQGGLTEFTLVDQDDRSSTVYVTKPDGLTKLTGKLPKGNLFGSLAHAWLYDRDVAKPDRANRTAWGLYPTRYPDGRTTDDAAIVDRLWQQLRDLSPVPLAEDWRAPVLELAVERKFVTWLDAPGGLCPPLGHVMACRLELGAEFINAISAAVRDGSLQVPGLPAAARATTARRDPVEQPTRQIRPQAGKALALGRIVVSHGVHAEVATEIVMDCLRRHRSGDWGSVSEADRRRNDQALKTGEERILSAFAIDPDLPCEGHSSNTLWVITERDRSATTVLYPSEY